MKMYIFCHSDARARFIKYCVIFQFNSTYLICWSYCPLFIETGLRGFLHPASSTAPGTRIPRWWWVRNIRGWGWWWSTSGTFPAVILQLARPPRERTAAIWPSSITGRVPGLTLPPPFLCQDLLPDKMFGQVEEEKLAPVWLLKRKCCQLWMYLLYFQFQTCKSLITFIMNFKINNHLNV